MQGGKVEEGKGKIPTRKIGVWGTRRRESKDAGLPDIRRRDPHNPGESPALRGEEKRAQRCCAPTKPGWRRKVATTRPSRLAGDGLGEAGLARGAAVLEEAAGG